ncbi:MAG: alpha/beta fold hydrolase [Dehalococcoidia bacterium]|nr:alpha/beta fold hydrolase [Dehalococcoidia bacterium]
MPIARLDDIGLAYEEAGSGFPLVWIHEFGGSQESWEQQVHFFARRYRVITYNARGYPPSDVPQDPDAYSEDHAVQDLHGLLRHLGIDSAYIGGLSMGGTTALHFGMKHPEMAKGLIVAPAGTGATDPVRFRAQCEALADKIERGGTAALREYATGPTRVRLQRKDPTGWQEFADLLTSHSPLGSALTMRGVQARRRPILEYGEELRRMQIPTLIMAGDEDEPCIEPAIFLKRHLSHAGLVMFPQSGHAINLEEPDLFNRAVLDFLTAIEAGKWAPREEGSGAGFLAERDP